SAGKDFGIRLHRGTALPSSPLILDDIPQNFDAVETLALKGGPVLTLSARNLIASGKPETWLAGPQVTEWWFSGPLRDPQGAADPHLMVRLGLRSYGKDRPLRVEFDVE